MKTMKYHENLLPCRAGSLNLVNEEGTLECNKCSATVAGNYSNSKSQDASYHPSRVGSCPPGGADIGANVILGQDCIAQGTLVTCQLVFSGRFGHSSSVHGISPLSSVSLSWALKEMQPFHLSMSLAICCLPFRKVSAVFFVCYGDVIA